MKTLWLLIILGQHQHEAHIQPIDFPTAQECVAARDEVMKAVNGTHRADQTFKAVCVKKTVGPSS